MGDESPEPASTLTGAVFLSYASQDAEPARKICVALQAAGIEVWFDQSELRGGDAWDHKIRQQIHDCALFIPVVSAHSDARHEGYFRREWRLAVERAGDMSERVPFLLPVVIDETSDARADVPDRFRGVQWTRLPNGEPSAVFVQRVRRLLSPQPNPGSAASQPATTILGTTPGARPASHWNAVLLGISAVAVVGLGWLIANRVLRSQHAQEPPPASVPADSAASSTAAFNPPPHSVAVLPFVNLSGDKEQEYFSDGLTEEILNSLTHINELQVSARTSSFSFRGKDTDISTVAHKLNVASILEGSVRRSGHTVRITTQLINAVTGFHLWSETYDRNLSDVLKLQTDIANAVAGALKVTLLGNLAAKIELGGTHNPAAFDAYLRGAKALASPGDVKALETAIAAYTEAIRLDQSYALAFASRSVAYSIYAGTGARGAAIQGSFDKAHADAREAIALAPDLADGHSALAVYLESGLLDFARATEEFERALALAPGNAFVLRASGRFLVYMGQSDEGISAARRAVALDPLNPRSHSDLGGALYYAHRYREAIAAYADSIGLDPAYKETYGDRGLAYYKLGDLQSARSTCLSNSDYWVSQWCLAVVYDKLGGQADAKAELARLTAVFGDAAAYQYATIYAQWGNTPKALEWLDTATRLRDPGLAQLKTDPLMDPLRKEPRFQVIEQALNFPQ
jgi:TolB-like protein/tetratricopeptide (TPR) repeat protein